MEVCAPRVNNAAMRGCNLYEKVHEFSGVVMHVKAAGKDRDHQHYLLHHTNLSLMYREDGRDLQSSNRLFIFVPLLNDARMLRSSLNSCRSLYVGNNSSCHPPPQRAGKRVVSGRTASAAMDSEQSGPRWK